MNKVVFSLGSNCDEAFVEMNKCITWLTSLLTFVKVSHIYETVALNGKDKNYLNAVFVGYTDMQYELIKNIMKEYEKRQGRTPESKMLGVIPIDIDVVIWNEDVMRKADFMQAYFQIGWNAVNNDGNNKLTS